MSLEQLWTEWNGLSARWMMTLAHFLWQGLAIALLAQALMVLMKRASASARYTALVGGLALMTLCPIVTFALLGESATPRPWPSLPPSASIAVAGQPLSPSKPPLSTASPNPSPIAISPAAAASTFSPSSPPPSASPISPMEERATRWLPVAATIYFAGVALLLGRLTLGLHGGRRLCRQSQTVADANLLAMASRQAEALGLRAVPALALAHCRSVTAPMAAGILKPTILLPLSFVSHLTPYEMEAILGHELAHIRRRDHLVNLWQRLLESFLFFHPAVWHLSRLIRIEREHCCDDLAVSLGAKPLEYAASLLKVAELSRLTATRGPAIVGLHAVRGPSDLRRRIARLLGSEREPSVRLLSAWPLVVAFAMTFALALIIPASRSSTSGQMPNEFESPSQPEKAAIRKDEPKAEAEAIQGEASNGLQAKIVAVTPGTDEQKPDIATAKAMTKFARSEDLTLLVELKNVSEQPISVQGVRYGDSVTPPWPGKSVSREFAPFLFDCEFFDKNGKPLDGPTRTMLDSDAMLTLSGGSAQTIEPNQSLTMLIQPLRWSLGVAQEIDAGEYRIRVRYHGPKPEVMKSIKQHWPEKPIASVWTGDSASGTIPFVIADATASKKPELAWGPAVNGLQAAVEFRSASETEQSVLDTATATFPHGAKLDPHLHVKNTSDRTISFWSETWRQDDTVTVIDEAGKEQTLPHPWYSGWPRTERWTLEPGQVAVLRCISLGLAANAEGENAFEHPIGGVIVGKPGKRQLRYDLSFRELGLTGPDGKKVVPDDNAWQGSLTTGLATITMRERRPEDEPPTFTARIAFQSLDGEPIKSGHIEAYPGIGGRTLASAELAAGQSVSVPNCPFETLRVNIRAPGYEETTFYDVAVKPNEVTTLKLKPAEPLMFRLVTRQGQPVAGAKVRYFNRSKKDASAGPYPSRGLEGPILGTSKANGEVTLDTLQKLDPNDHKLGNNIYWFYIEPFEPVNAAPLFIGPVEAGQNLGEIQVGPLLEVSGEVRGTPQELEAFSAEWDQPEPMKRGNGEHGWDYAQSQRLETANKGDKLTFRVTGLRPGPFRIVSRFKRGGEPISHVYTRREPNKDDVVFKINLTDSRDNLVVTNQPQPSDDK